MLKRFWKEWGKELLLALVIAIIIRVGVLEARVVPTPSMVPTVEPGDRLLAEKLIYRIRGIKHGDIVVFLPPMAKDDNTLGRLVGLEEDYLKRVIGLSGDQIEIREGHVYVNGSPLDEPYIESAPRYTFGPVTVPKGKLFVLGDNRNNSNDSHVWGFLDESSVRSRAVFRFWPLHRIGFLH